MTCTERVVSTSKPISVNDTASQENDMHRLLSCHGLKRSRRREHLHAQADDVVYGIRRVYGFEHTMRSDSRTSTYY